MGAMVVGVLGKGLRREFASWLMKHVAIFRGLKTFPFMLLCDHLVSFVQAQSSCVRLPHV
jgi:hypothetical protein